VKHTFTLGLQSLAKELGIWICAGIHEIPRDDEVEDLKESRKVEKVLNSHVAIGPDGIVKGCYRKVGERRVGGYANGWFCRVEDFSDERFISSIYSIFN
jgi:predicted amidohydrolase